MKDYLEKICVNLGIKLVYTTNKLTVLACNVKDNIPVIRAHKIFKNCPENLAVAIIEYYTKSQNEEKNIKIIDEYVKGISSEIKFKIQPPNETFKEIFINNMPAEEPAENGFKKVTEYKILSMVQTDFYGNQSKIKPGEFLSPRSDDILELDITIQPPST